MGSPGAGPPPRPASAAAGAAWIPGAAAVLARLLLAGLSDAQISRLADLRARVHRGPARRRARRPRSHRPR
jgi:hypothetical protein